jgi:hypothetical protein
MESMKVIHKDEKHFDAIPDHCQEEMMSLPTSRTMMDDLNNIESQ